MEMNMQIDDFVPIMSPNLTPKKLKHDEDDVAQVFGNTTVVEGSASGSLKSGDASNSYSDMSFCSENDDDDGDDVSDYDDEADYTYYDDDADDDDDDYLKMQAQFDNVDLPPGVEASVSWLNDPSPSTKTLPSSSTSLLNEAGTSSSIASLESSSAGKELVKTEHEVLRKFQAFKRFDTVADFSDHHYTETGFSGNQPPKSWTKKVQQEWKILEEGLPDKIFVRVYETRMDLLRAVIVGPAGTPYHDGLFVFDVHFPPTYPDVPPMVFYYSGGLRLNPNLYECGKVCLSLLNTWSGNKKEMWMPRASTMLQVLVSIQALILNVEPFFNEPGNQGMYSGLAGQKKSKEYNEDVFILSLKTMIYTLRRPPKYFEDLVSGHFSLRGYYILYACKAYLEGAEIGSLVADNPKEAAKRNIDNHPGEFKGAVSALMNSLVTFFTNNGSGNCEQFRVNVQGTILLCFENSVQMAV